MLLPAFITRAKDSLQIGFPLLFHFLHRHGDRLDPMSLGMMMLLDACLAALQALLFVLSMATTTVGSLAGLDDEQPLRIAFLQITTAIRFGGVGDRPFVGHSGGDLAMR